MIISCDQLCSFYCLDSSDISGIFHYCLQSVLLPWCIAIVWVGDIVHLGQVIASLSSCIFFLCCLMLFFSLSLTPHLTFQEKNERYLLLFPHVLLMLSASPRMSGFIFQVELSHTSSDRPDLLWVFFPLVSTLTR